MLIRPSLIRVGSEAQIDRIGKNFANRVKNFHDVNLTGILGIDLVEWREIGRVKD